MKMLSETLKGIIISEASRKVTLKEMEEYYIDNDGNLWYKLSGYYEDEMADWKLDLKSIKVISS